MHVATPAPRDRQARPPVIPPSVAAARARATQAAEQPKKKTEKDMQVTQLACSQLSELLQSHYIATRPGSPQQCENHWIIHMYVMVLSVLRDPSRIVQIVVD